MLMIFLEGLIIGFAISAPVGPIALLCVQRTLKDGFKVGFASGLGAATADNFYGLVAAFGLTAIYSLLIAFQYWIRIVGGLCLIYFGLKLCCTKFLEKDSKPRHVESLWHAYITTFILTITNPITLLSLIAVFSALGLGGRNMGYFNALFLVLGICTGSTSWWLLLTSGVSFFIKDHISVRAMKILNWISGGVMLAFSIYALKIII